MKVLHVINNLGSGGAESMLLNFFRTLEKSTDTFEILLLENDTIAYKNIPSHIKITFLSNSKRRYSLKKLFALYRYIKRNSFDLVHSHLFPSQYYVFLVKLLLNKKIKLVTTEHNTTNTRRKYWFLRLIDKIVYSGYDSIILISDGVQIQFKTDFHKQSKKTIIINNGIPVDQFKPPTLKKESEKIKLVMVASFTNQKDHLTLLKALQLLDKNICLSLVGEGELLDEIESYVNKYQLAKRVSFLGFRDDITSVYNEHDIFVLSSHWEGFGLVAIESMACGLPVIASDVEGLRDVVKGAGLLFEAKNEIALADHIRELANKPNLRTDLIQKGFLRSKEYDIKNLVKNTINLYRKIL